MKALKIQKKYTLFLDNTPYSNLACKAQPWSPFIAGNDKKKDEPEVK